MTQGPVQNVQVDLAVAGCGLAGVASAYFAAQEGLSVVLCGSTGGLVFTSGYFDVLGYAERGNTTPLSDPWAGVEELSAREPAHPYARCTPTEIHSAMREFLQFTAEAGLPYADAGDSNFQACTMSGLPKTTWALPQTMRAGVDMLQSSLPCLVVSFAGLKGFSARQFAAVLSSRRPNIRAVSCDFPGMEGRSEVYAEHMARAMEVPGACEKLAERLRPHLADAKFVGMPAMLGIHDCDAVCHKMEELLGCPVFEIPSMPPSVPGIRLREAYELALSARGVMLLPRHKVLQARQGANGWTLDCGARELECQVEAKNLLLATGRFLGGGLQARRTGIRESILDLPVHQPEGRSMWHRLEYFDLRGHELNRAGVQVDDACRPVGVDGQPVYPNLYAAGSILGYQDWIRSRCGTGLAVATAQRAVAALREQAV